MFQNKENIQKESQILHVKEIVKRDLNKIRISFSEKFLNAKFQQEINDQSVKTLHEDLKKIFILNDCEDVYNAHIENFEHFKQTGDILKPLNLQSEESQLFWGIALGYYASHPEIALNWAQQKNRGSRLSETTIWKRIEKSSYMQKELTKHAYVVNQSLDSKDTKIIWHEHGYPNVSYCFIPNENVIVDDMLWTLVCGTDAASTAINHEIAHSQGTQFPVTPKMQALEDKQAQYIKDMERLSAANDKDGWLKVAKQAARAQVEHQYRFYFVDELENMFANRYSVEFGGDYDRAHLNELETVLNAGSKYLNAKQKQQIKKEIESSPEKRVMHIKAIARNSFFANNGLVSNYQEDDWRSIMLFPELLNGVDADGRKMGAKESFERIREICNTFEEKCPSFQLKLLDERLYKVRMTALSKQRSKLVDEFFDTFVAHHMEEIYKKAEQNIEDTLNQLQQMTNQGRQGNQQQQGGQGSQQQQQGGQSSQQQQQGGQSSQQQQGGQGSQQQQQQGGQGSQQQQQQGGQGSQQQQQGGQGSQQQQQGGQGGQQQQQGEERGQQQQQGGQGGNNPQSGQGTGQPQQMSDEGQSGGSQQNSGQTLENRINQNQNGSNSQNKNGEKSEQNGSNSQNQNGEKSEQNGSNSQNQNGEKSEQNGSNSQNQNGDKSEQNGSDKQNSSGSNNKEENSKNSSGSENQNQTGSNSQNQNGDKSEQNGSNSQNQNGNKSEQNGSDKQNSSGSEKQKQNGSQPQNGNGTPDYSQKVDENGYPDSSQFEISEKNVNKGDNLSKEEKDKISEKAKSEQTVEELAKDARENIDKKELPKRTTPKERQEAEERAKQNQPQNQGENPEDDISQYAPENEVPILIRPEDMRRAFQEDSSKARKILAGTYDKYQQRIAKYKDEIARTKQLIEKIITQKKFDSIKHGRTQIKKEKTLLPYNGAQTLDVTRQIKLNQKIRARDPRLSEEDFKRFKSKRKFQEEELIEKTEIEESNFAFIIDGSGSMSGGPFECAFDTACVLYEATKNFKEVNVFIYVMGWPDPTTIAKPGMGTKEIAQKLDGVYEGGVYGASDHLIPAVTQAMADIAENMGKHANRTSGFIHVFPITDGGNNDYEGFDPRNPSAAYPNQSIKTLIDNNEYLTFDWLFVDTCMDNYTKPFIDEMKKKGCTQLDYVSGVFERGQKDSKKSVISDKIIELLSKRLKHSQVEKKATNDVKRKLIEEGLRKLKQRR